MKRCAFAVFSLVLVALTAGPAAAQEGAAAALVLPTGEAGNVCTKYARTEGAEKQEYDVNGDGKADVVKYIRIRKNRDGSTDELAALQTVDLNGDGKVDVWTLYDTGAGQTAAECFDLDYDGGVDKIDFYAAGTIVRSELALRFDAKPQVFVYFNKGKLARKERDRNGDGRIDYWEYYENEKLQWIGYDNDGDGNIDERKEARTSPAASPAP